MNAIGILNTKAAATGIGILVGAGVLYWVVNKILDKFKDKLPPPGSFDPTSDKNLAYRGVNAVGAAISDDPSWSLGSWAYDLFNPPYDPNAGMKYAPRKLQVREESAVFDYLTKH